MVGEFIEDKPFSEKVIAFGKVSKCFTTLVLDIMSFKFF